MRASHFRIPFQNTVNCKVLLFILVSTLISTGTFAGTGTYKDGKFNFCVSIRFDASPADMDTIEKTFQRASEVLFDATDSQMCFGTIKFITDSGAENSAEYWIDTGKGRPKVTVGGYGNYGERCILYFNTNFVRDSGAEGDAYTVVHEHAHLAFGVYDEYDTLLLDPEIKCADGADDLSLNYSIMDNFFVRGGRAVSPRTYTLNEFCVPGNHEPTWTPSTQTPQGKLNGESCWETIVKTMATKFGDATISIPAGLPRSDPPIYTPPTDFELCSGDLSAVLCIDRSGSMNSYNRMDLAKGGAKSFLGALRREKEYRPKSNIGLGITAFTNYASVVTNFVFIDGTEDQESIISDSIDNITTYNLTNIWDGLRLSLEQFSMQATCSCRECIVLLSDGDYTAGPDPVTYIPSLQNAGVVVIAVGVGSQISGPGETRLRTVAESTRGEFYRIRDGSDIPAFLDYIARNLHDDGIIAFAPIMLRTGTYVNRLIQIEGNTEQTVFSLKKEDTTDEIILALQSPSGTVITKENADSYPDISYFEDSYQYTYSVRSPDAGEWTMTAHGIQVKSGTAKVLVSSKHSGVQLITNVTAAVVDYPQPIIIKAIPQYEGSNVVGATVQGYVERPGGADLNIMLYDDGVEEHGDKIANDGEYSAKFTEYTTDGTYQFYLNTVNEAGTKAPGEGLFSSVPPDNTPVPAFTRSAIQSVVVNEVPGLSDGKAEGKGYVLIDNNNRYRGYFKFTISAQAGNKTGSGMFRLSGPSSGRVYMDITSVDNVRFTPDGKGALIKGTCRVNGVTGYQYFIEAKDKVSPGARNDLFACSITGPNNYFFTSCNTITGGEVTVNAQ